MTTKRKLREDLETALRERDEVSKDRVAVHEAKAEAERQRDQARVDAEAKGRERDQAVSEREEMRGVAVGDRAALEECVRLRDEWARLAEERARERAALDELLTAERATRATIEGERDEAMRECGSAQEDSRVLAERLQQAEDALIVVHRELEASVDALAAEQRKSAEARQALADCRESRSIMQAQRDGILDAAAAQGIMIPTPGLRKPGPMAGLPEALVEAGRAAVREVAVSSGTNAILLQCAQMGEHIGHPWWPRADKGPEGQQMHWCDGRAADGTTPYRFADRIAAENAAIGRDPLRMYDQEGDDIGERVMPDGWHDDHPGVLGDARLRFEDAAFDAMRDALLAVTAVEAYDADEVAAKLRRALGMLDGEGRRVRTEPQMTDEQHVATAQLRVERDRALVNLREAHRKLGVERAENDREQNELAGQRDALQDWKDQALQTIYYSGLAMGEAMLIRSELERERDRLRKELAEMSEFAEMKGSVLVRDIVDGEDPRPLIEHWQGVAARLEADNTTLTNRANEATGRAAAAEAALREHESTCALEHTTGDNVVALAAELAEVRATLESEREAGLLPPDEKRQGYASYRAIRGALETVERERDDLRTENEALNSEREDALAALQQVKSERDELRPLAALANVQSAREQIMLAEARTDRAEAEFANLTRERDEARSERDEARGWISAVNEALGDHRTQAVFVDDAVKEVVRKLHAAIQRENDAVPALGSVLLDDALEVALSKLSAGVGVEAWESPAELVESALDALISARREAGRLKLVLDIIDERKATAPVEVERRGDG